MSELSRARHWRMRAIELRAIAETMRGDPEERAKVRALADDLDQMADRLEKDQSPPSSKVR